MVRFFDIYLSQIRKKLQQKAISAEETEEFIDNLEDQLYSMLEEIQGKEFDLTQSEAEVAVLTQCEPVEIVVHRVVEQLNSDLSYTDLKTDQLPRLTFLQPVESTLIFLATKFNQILTFVDKRAVKIKHWYLRNENPLLTMCYYFLLIILSIIGIQIIFSILPPIYRVTTYPDKKTGIYFFNIPASISDNPQITYFSSTLISQALAIFTILILVSILVVRIGWKYDTSYAIKTGTLLAFLLVGVIMILQTGEGRLYFVLYRINDGNYNMFTQDWSWGYPPTLNDYMFDFVTRFGNLYLIPISFSCFALILFGSILKNVRKRNFPRPLTFTGIRYGVKIVLMSSALVFALSSPFYYTEFPRTDLPLPSIEIPLIYNFSVDRSQYSTLNLSKEYSTTLPDFGYVKFQLSQFYNLSVETFEPNLHISGQLSPVGNTERTTASHYAFPLLGTLYLPNRSGERSWQEFIGFEINSTYPFQGFVPSIDTTRTSLKWLANRKETMISINTIRYSSTANDTEYIFSFDPTTGWLMKATLKKYNTSWIDELDIDTLSITRYFTVNSVRNYDEFYLLDTLLMIPILSVSILIFGGSGLYYFIRAKMEKNKKRKQG